MATSETDNRMMQITHLKLKNFQAHEKIVLKFSPAITTIVGPSDIGKSAILRALGWVCLNNMSGSEFVKEGAKQAEVSVKLQEGEKVEIISRARSANGVTNTYEQGGDEFKAFGQGVPDSIAAELQLNDINFQGQHDSPFWFNETAGEVSRRLNAVIDLTVIDSSLSYIGSEVRRNQERLTLYNERLKTVLDELKTIEPEREKINEFEKLKEKHKVTIAAEEDRDQLEALVSVVRSSPHKRLASRAKDGKDVLTAAELSMDTKDTAFRLRSLLERIQNLKRESSGPPDFEPVTNLFEKSQRLNERCDALSDYVEGLEALEKSIKELGKRAEKVEEDFHERIKGMKCPTCGNLIQ